MSAQSNVETTKAAYAAFSAGDAEAAMAAMADDIEWIVAGDSAISGTYRGKAEVGGFWAQLAGKGFVTDPQQFLADGDTVVVLTRATVGGESSDQADVLTFDDGKLVKFRGIGDTALQVRVFGSK